MNLSSLFTILNRGTHEPVVPFDANPDSDDEGMLVYRCRAAAESAAEHQAECYDLDCEAGHFIGYRPAKGTR